MVGVLFGPNTGRAFFAAEPALGNSLLIARPLPGLQSYLFSFSFKPSRGGALGRQHLKRNGEMKAVRYKWKEGEVFGSLS